ncbi:hypothetical protein ACOTJG_28265 [Achromobacter xylosoxidans]|uniref:hypothetical protein n=1 Tax=Alcaligenes xylosoxydans xylosoxydans TaxID=85698 RepID=UPI0006C29638|nr:hypothetical protein [Achromobacter xylosoxidans]QQE56117.1 hypothetical protein I6H41_24840 [Achromobacter xylosoxidans]QQV15758.1 hypothetical protein I6I48_07780 [Achromobacter xylosoxidans]UXL05873.1 hypothetical protein N4T34_03860 [Achromobacter xylosoxidans]CUI27480.1 Uncharacterised protein [Achromobacter xylosoxidans]
MTIKTTFRKVVNVTTDALEKTSSPTSRAGITVNRVAKMAHAGVQASVIAKQLTENSRNGNRYSRTHVEAFVMLQQDATTKVGVTASQATALIQDQTDNSQTGVSEVTPGGPLAPSEGK